MRKNRRVCEHGFVYTDSQNMEPYDSKRITYYLKRQKEEFKWDCQKKIKNPKESR